jgi:hypothetical protein
MLFASVICFIALTAAMHEDDKQVAFDHRLLGIDKNMLEGDLPVGMNDMFMGSGRCAGCHGIDQDVNNPPLANVDAAGNQVSPAENWRATMMANSSKDPMWRAKVAHETTVNPAHAQELINKCASCHAPLGRFEAEHDGVEFQMAMLETDSLANDGVSCMACHAQQIETTGNVFSGELHYNPDTLWGPVFNVGKSDLPVQTFIMQSFVGIVPNPHERFSQSETCAGCHTLSTHTADLSGNFTGETFIEQATYHEWLNSSYSQPGPQSQECQGCHMPRLDEGVIIASGYEFIPPRQPYGQHWLVGGNSFMLELMKNRIPQLGITANESHFNTVINRTLDNLQNHSAEMQLIPGQIDGDTARYTLRVTNKTGHKLPSGYPARRAFVEFIVMNEDGQEIFHSGGIDNTYNIVGQDASWEPHYNVITQEDQVQIYEMVIGDVNGNPTTVLERAHHYIKDNRLVPLGFTTEHAVYDTTQVVGALWDADFNSINGNFGSGTDDIHYHIPVSGVNGEITVIARLHYQSLPPKWNEEMFSIDHPTINAFEQMYWEEGPDPVLMVSAQTTSTIIHVGEIVRLCTIGPNPTDDGVVTISAGRDIIRSIRVYDMAGNLIDSRSPNSNRTQTRLPGIAGTYLLEIETSRGRSLERVVRR